MEYLKTTITPVYSLIGVNGVGGGIFKRIAEMREITEAIRSYRPELFHQEPGLLHWLSASDDFLCRLSDAAMPKGADEWCDSERERWEKSLALHQLTPQIYDEVRAQLNSAMTIHPLAIPPGGLKNHKVLEAATTEA